MDRENLRQLEENFARFIRPLLGDDGEEELRFIHSYDDFVESKTLRLLQSDTKRQQKWKEL